MFLSDECGYERQPFVIDAGNLDKVTFLNIAEHSCNPFFGMVAVEKNVFRVLWVLTCFGHETVHKFADFTRAPGVSGAV